MKKGYLLVFLTAVISGFSIFINRFAVSVIDPYIFTWLKNLIVAILITSLFFLFRDWGKLKSITKRNWFLLIIIGLIGGSIPFLLFFKGLALTTASQGSFWHKTLFIFVAFFSALFLREKINKRFFIGGFLLVLGNLILLKTIPHSLDRGDLLVLLATLFWAVENTISKYALRELDGKTVAWGRMFFGSFFIFIFLLTTGQLALLSAVNSNQLNWVMISSVLLFGYVITWYQGLKYIPVSQATTILLFGSPLTTFLSLLSGGKVSSQEILSGVLVILGIIFIIGLKESWRLIKETKNLFHAIGA